MNPNGWWKTLTGLFLINLISACSVTPVTTAEQDARIALYQARANEIESRENWEMEGRLAVNDGKDGGSGNFNWTRQSGTSHMDFHGALGRGAWRLDADETGARLELANGEMSRAATVNDLARQQLGWQIPVDALEWWVRGLEAPGKSQHLELDERGLLVRLTQFGWDIEFQRYNESEVVVMPYKVTARRQEQTVKLAVRRWYLSAPGSGDD